MDKIVSMDRHLRIVLLYTSFLFSGFFFFKTGNVLFLIIALSFIGILIVTNQKYARNYSNIMKKSFEKSLNKNDFVYDDSYLADDYLSGLAINESTSKLAILQRNNSDHDFTFKSINFKDIIECSIMEDGETVTRSSKSSVIGGAMVGGVLAGGVGTIVGGLSGNKYSSEKILKATLSIVVDDLKNPVFEINFLNSKMLVDRNGQIYRNIYSKMNYWNKMVSVILKRNVLNSKSV